VKKGLAAPERNGDVLTGLLCNGMPDVALIQVETASFDEPLARGGIVADG
jgi:hypothetical protein